MNYDAVVIGAGPGGYEAALQLAKAGLKTLLIEQSKDRIGGICLNEGCIPAKNYLQNAEYALKASFFKESGIKLEISNLNMGLLKEKTKSLCNELRSGIVWALDQAGVEIIYGSANFLDASMIEVSGKKISFGKCIIATGSKAAQLNLAPFDGKNIISSREVFELENMPSSIAIIGGGAIGCEFATFFNAFGAEVTLIENQSSLLPLEDKDIAKALMREFKKRNINLLMKSSLENIEVKDQSVKLLVNGNYINCDLVLCAIGRIPNTEGLNLEKAGVGLNENGYIKVNKSFQTALKNIYAVGDCIQTPGFAHTAYCEAKIAVQNIISGRSGINSHITPTAIFSIPSIASCGLKEWEAQESGILIEVKKAYFKVNSKAKILGDDSGFAKIIVCAKTGVVLGASIIGAEATEIIHEMVLAVEKNIKAEELKEIIHAHPTVSEIVNFL